VIREFREKKSLTQADLVTKLNLAGWDLSRETLAKIETRIRWVADFELLKIAEALEIEAEDLVRRMKQSSQIGK
jgi:transcriptional regulator with XRE-family HTH domain